MPYPKVTYAEQAWYLVKYKLKEVCTMSQALIFLLGAFFGALLYSVFVDHP